jgi:hypothetical protein
VLYVVCAAPSSDLPMAGLILSLQGGVEPFITKKTKSKTLKLRENVKMSGED